MKNVIMFAFALVSTTAFAGAPQQGPGPSQGKGQGQYQGPGQGLGDNCDNGRSFGTHRDRAIGPARGEYSLNSRGASCDGARAMVASRGSVILYYGDDLFTRIVRDGSFCSNDQTLSPFWAGACFVGYECVERND